MSVSIGGLFLAGVVPGVLIGLSLMVTVLIYAKRRRYPVYARASLREFCEQPRAGLAGLADAGDHRRRHRRRIVHADRGVGGRGALCAAAGRLGLPLDRSRGELPQVLYESARFAAISLFCIGTASAFGWLLAYFHVPQRAGRRDRRWSRALRRRAHGCLGVPDHRMFIDAIPAIIILGHDPLPGGRRRRHAPDPLRDHRRDLARLRPGDAALRPVPDDRLRDRARSPIRRRPARTSRSSWCRCSACFCW